MNDKSFWVAWWGILAIGAAFWITVIVIAILVLKHNNLI